MEDFAFTSLDLSSALKLGDKSGYRNYIMGASQFNTKLKARVYAVPPNYFDVVQSEYYVPKKVQEGLTGIKELPNGDLDPVEMLYSDQSLPSYPETWSNNKNAYNITYS